MWDSPSFIGIITQQKKPFPDSFEKTLIYGLSVDIEQRPIPSTQRWCCVIGTELELW